MRSKAVCDKMTSVGPVYSLKYNIHCRHTPGHCMHLSLRQHTWCGKRQSVYHSCAVSADGTYRADTAVE